MSSSDLLSTPFKRGETETDRPFPKLVRKTPRRGGTKGQCHSRDRFLPQEPPFLPQEPRFNAAAIE